jgi:hypothetical protein
MGLFFWKDNNKIDSFALAVADELFSHVQPDNAREFFGGKPRLKKKQLLKIERKFNNTILQVQRFLDSNSLGIYGKARLQKQFNSRLAELGYEIEVVNRISELMLLRRA